MLKNEEKIGVVSAIGSNGEGIIKEDKYIIFVPFALISEKIRYKVLKVNKNIVYGKLIEVIEPSKNRTKPICSVFSKCGGCQMQHINYINQLEIKRENIKNTFRKIAFLDIEPQNVVTGNLEFRYRNKLQLPVVEVNGETLIGFYAENSHRVVKIDDCYINPEWTKEIIFSFNQFIKENNLSGYNEEKNSGDIREITVKEIDNKLIITLVTPKKTIKNIENLVEILDKNIKKEYSLFININENKTNVIYGDKFNLIKGQEFYTSNLLGITYQTGVLSFMQVNTEVCKKLYKTVLEEIAPDEKMTVIDAYSGAGLMTAILSKNAKRGIGIEIIKEAVENANALAVNNGLENKITNYLGKCEEIMPDIIKNELKNNSNLALVLDPPRKGCERNVIEAVINSGIEKIVYVSCLPASLSRDVGLICGTLEYSGNEIKKVENPTLRYKVKKVIPFDMFPQTKHIETLCVLEKIK